MNLTTYFENVAKKLKELLHTNDSTHYLKVNGYDNMLGIIEKDNYLSGFQLVHDISSNGRFFAENNDQILDRRPGMFYVLRRVEKTNIVDVEQCHKETLTIGKKIISKMRRDQYLSSLNQSSLDLRNLDAASFTYQSVGPLVSGWHGTMFQFSLVEAPGIIYHPEDWTE